MVSLYAASTIACMKVLFKLMPGIPRLRENFRSLYLPPFLVFVLILILLLVAISTMDLPSLGGDASQNLRSSFNLFRHDVYGENFYGLPGFRREPFPNWITALHLKWFVGVPEDITYADLVADTSILRRIMAVNFAWMLGLFVSIWALCLCIIRPFWLANSSAAIVIFLSFEYFALNELNSLNTELPAAYLLVMTGLGLVIMEKTIGPGWAWFAGFAFGTLVLTKASGAYLALILLPLFPLLATKLSLKAVRLGLSLALGFAMVVLPWTARNHIEFGQFVIAEGGGRVLLVRSEFNKMSSVEFKGAFYAYAPKLLREHLFEPYLGFSQDQLDCGGNLESLNRDLLCDQNNLANGHYEHVRSFYQRGKRAIPRKIMAERNKSGESLWVDKMGRSIAIDRIRANPLKHLLVSIPLGWRGFWPFPDRDWLCLSINILAMLSLLIMPIMGLIKQRYDWALISITGVAFFFFYAFLSHFIPRYSEPLVPLSLICLAALTCELFKIRPKSKKIFECHDLHSHC